MVQRKSMLGDNPLDSLLPPTKQDAPSAKPSTKKQKEKPVIATVKPKEEATPELMGEKERLTILISKDLVGKVKDCVYWNRATLTGFIEQALKLALQEAEKKNGSPFEKRSAELRPGRPLK